MDKIVYKQSTLDRRHRDRLAAGKVCARCEMTIPVTRRSDALYCSDSCASRTRNGKFYSTHVDKIAEKRKYYLSRAEITMLSRIKHRAKSNGIPFNLEASDIHIPLTCPVLGIPLQVGERRGYNPTSPSLDRIVPKLGYVKGNVRVISARANLLKNDATVEELQLVLADLLSLRASDSVIPTNSEEV